MEFLYGDSTPSTLSTDYVDFLRKALDCFVALLQAEQRMVQGTARRRQLEAAAEQDVARLRELEGTVSRAISLAISGTSPDAPVARCSDVIARAASGAVASAEADVQAAVKAEGQRIEDTAAKERGRCVKAFEALLLEHDLPGSEPELRVEHRKEAAYAARLHGTTPYGVTVALELEVPKGSWFAQPFLVANVVEGLEIHVPRTAGWLRKESKLATEKLARQLVTSCVIGPRGKRVSIRTETLDEGYDFVVGGGGEKPVQATRVSTESPAPVEFDLAEADARAIEAFVERLGVAAQDLLVSRKALSAAALDGEALEKHRQPSLLVQRLIEVMSPTVREISARSGSEKELVIRRLLGDGRREERFVRRSDLLEKLEPLPASARAMFVPLGLGTVTGPPPPEEVNEEISSGYIVEEVVGGHRADAAGLSHPPPLRTQG